MGIGGGIDWESETRWLPLSGGEVNGNMVAVPVGRAELDKDTVRGAAGLEGVDGNTVAGLLAGERCSGRESGAG